MILPYLSAWLEARAKKWLEAGETRIPVRVLPTIGWGKSGSLTADGNSNNAVQLQVKFLDQIQAHTIQFDGPDCNVNPGVGVIAPCPEAEILWSVNGVTNRRLVNVLDGQSVSGLAQAVTVNIRDTATGGDGSAYVVGMTVTPGVRADTQQPPTFVPSGVTNAGTAFKFRTALIAAAFAVWTVPANAGVISVYFGLRMAVGTVLESIEIQFMTANGGVIGSYDGSIRNRWFPIPIGTNTIKLVNNTATTITASLTLGIDG